jgi:hypothetical protein
MKRCATCNENKEYTDFQRNSQQKDGYSCYCRSCTTIAYKVRYEENKNNQDWQLQKMLNASRTRATRKNLEHTLTLNELQYLYPDDNKCPVFGFELDWGHPKWSSPSLDRIDSTKGYTYNNCQIISNKANMLKNDATLEELELLVNYLKEIKF